VRAMAAGLTSKEADAAALAWRTRRRVIRVRMVVGELLVTLTSRWPSLAVELTSAASVRARPVRIIVA
jgi:hypothetical protein